MENLSKEPKLIEAAAAVDDRGILTFVNDFNFNGVKRFYMVENFSTQTVRAFHGHLKEKKYVLLISGSAIIAVVKMTNPLKPSKDTKVQRFVLSARKPAILYIPPGYANGFRFMEENTKIIFFSTASLEESKNDDYRFPYDYWGKDIWQAKFR